MLTMVYYRGNIKQKYEYCKGESAMTKLAKYFVPFLPMLAAAILLLALQAYGDLSLPEYMSDIVNTGISQEGIEHAAPEAIRETAFDAVKLLMREDAREAAEAAYTLINSEDTDLIKKYPQAAHENVYVLTKAGKENLLAFESALGKALLVFGMISDPDSAPLLEAAGVGIEMPVMQLPPGMDFATALAHMDEAQRGQMLDKIEESTAILTDTVLVQAAARYIKAEYEAIGVDVEKLQTDYILSRGGSMLLLSLLIMVTVVLESLLAARIAAGMGRNLRRDVFTKVMQFSGAEFDKFSTASLITRSTNDIQRIQQMLVMLIRVVIYAPIMGVGGVVKVLRTEASMTWIIALAVGLMMMIMLFMFIVAVPRFRKVQSLIDKVNLAMREALTGMLVIRAFNTQKHEEAKFDAANTNLTKTQIFIGRIMSGVFPVMNIVMNGIMLLILWIGAHNIDAGNLQVGDMMAFLQYAMQIIMAFLMIAMVSVMLPQATVSANRISEVLRTDISITDPEESKRKKFSGKQKGLVEFKNVSFKYPNAEDYVLQNISFTAKPGETTAFIGSTGSGKSTVINLLPRFYDVTEGEVLLDGVDVRAVSQKDLRAKIGYVPQKGLLFSGTIESNLKFGGDDISDADMKKAAEIAQATEFIEAKDLQFEEPIAQGGTNVSGGQRQRLSIARALAKKPEVFIFDDSFSALDFKTDAALRRALEKETNGATMLVVAQRIGTIKNAQQIIVLDQGQIVGKGTHDELMESCEVYREIATSQLSADELAGVMRKGGVAHV